MKIPTEIVSSVHADQSSPRAIGKSFDELLANGAKLCVSGTANKNPLLLSDKALRPRTRFRLFETEFYLSGIIQIPELRFFAAYIVQQTSQGKTSVFPRVFYKDLSLVWRSASHFAFEDDGDLWIGKGDVQHSVEDGFVMVESVESTTDLPIEIQSTLEDLLSHSVKAKKGNYDFLRWILKEGPSDRVEPYDDFVKPRERAATFAPNLINRGRSVAKFRKPGDPSSLQVTKGFEPDFSDGIIEKTRSQSRLYGGTLRRFRILSVNKLIQYYFIAGPKHVWIVPPQATTTQLSSYGVRTIDVVADDDLFIPGYEYHHEVITEFGKEMYSQIPRGFAGKICPVDDAKADASPWLEKIPLIREFRKNVLKQKL